MEHRNMTKLSKWLRGTAAAAITSIALVGFAGAFTASEAAAESPPAPPAKFVGKVTVDGKAPAPGTVIQAKVGAASCGVGTVFMDGATARYTLEVPALDPNASPNCGVEGATVAFWVGDKQAKETGSWLNYQLNQLGLSVVTPTPAPSATPKPPKTGSGLESSDSGASGVWLVVALGLGVVAFGAAGTVAARRGR
jgi:hypothetical protein